MSDNNCIYIISESRYSRYSPIYITIELKKYIMDSYVKQLVFFSEYTFIKIK